MNRLAWYGGILCWLLAIGSLRAGTLQIRVTDPEGARTGNCMPARVRMDFREVLKSPGARVNPATLRMVRPGPTGEPMAGPSVPVRFDDPDPKPDSFFHAYLGGGDVSGDLIFQHTVGVGGQTTTYRLAFESCSDADVAALAPASAQIGDYDILRYAQGPMSGIFQTKLTVCDWDGDGRTDIIAGDQLGWVVLYRRTGAGVNAFDVPLPLELDGKPLRMNWMCAPDAVDWDGDGDLDLVISDESSAVLFIENGGTRNAPRLSKPKPFVVVSGQPIKSPCTPVPEMSFFKKDYAPTPIAFDYNGDGKVDLLFGGYVTGLIYYYENVAPSAREVPVLAPRGTINDDEGQPIDVAWCAAPYLADLDGDGLPDLVSGHIAEEKKKFKWVAEPSLFFWKNTGTRAEPKWTKADFGYPAHWSDYPPDVTVPRVIDWNGDGKPDIVMTAGCEVFYFENTGTATAPKFAFQRSFTMANGPLLLCPRFNAIAPVLVDIDGDGMPDLVSGGSGDVSWSRMTSFGNAPRFDRRGYLEADGERIYHEFIHGDDTTFPFIFDWDGDGLQDILMGDGDGDGYVTFYRNVGTKSAPRFTSRGRLRLTDGRALCAGEPTPETVTDFEGHSGNRSVPAPGDYDGDGRLDLICSNAGGEVFFFRNVGGDRFAPGVMFASGNNRGWTYPVDWNGDGRLDVILSWSGGPQTVPVNRGASGGGAPDFEVVQIKNMPWIPHPRPLAVDWNQDGDIDLLWCSSYSLLHFAERDFIDHGYVEATLSGHDTETH